MQIATQRPMAPSTPVTLTPVPSCPAQRIFNEIQRDDEGAYGRFGGYRLGSAFQPIYSLAHHRAVGFEALVRARDGGGRPISPLELFAQPRDEGERIHLDRLCRSLHADNHRDIGLDDTWLFLNTDPRVVVPGPSYGPFFAHMLERYEIPPERVVVEILEGAIDDEGLLVEAVEHFRSLGCLVAVDDFGAGHSNFDRIWRLAPDIVKLDRSVIHHAATNDRARRMFPNLVSLIHEAGALVLAEGVETEEEALIAVKSEVDMAQGYWFGRPAPAAPYLREEHPKITALYDHFRDQSLTGEARRQRRLAPFREAFDRAAAALAEGAPLERAAARLMALDGASRCFLLGADGYQLGATLASGDGAVAPRYRPLSSDEHTSWFRRRYFRRAIARPGQQYASSPYLSLTGVHMCVTLSQAFRRGDETLVLCCDLDWDALGG